MRRKISFSESNQSFNVRFAETDQRLKVHFKGVQPITEYIGGEPYDGEYEITPRVDAQEMQTAGKVMLDNVVVKSIPFHKVSNASGGNTVHIGVEL